MENDDFEPCLDPDARITLFPLDDYKWDEKSIQRPLALKTEARKLTSGRFATEQESFQSLIIEGRCCWEAFSKPAFQGKKLRKN